MIGMCSSSSSFFACQIANVWCCADRFVGYLIREGFYKEKYVNFPHKRAALMRLSREAWCGPAA